MASPQIIKSIKEEVDKEQAGTSPKLEKQDVHKETINHEGIDSEEPTDGDQGDSESTKDIVNGLKSGLEMIQTMTLTTISKEDKNMLSSGKPPSGMILSSGKKQ